MARLQDVVGDANVHGFSVVLSWLKPGSSRPGGQAVNESVAVFMDKASALDYLERQLRRRLRRTLARWASTAGGPRPAGLEIWDDDFARRSGAELRAPAGITC